MPPYLFPERPFGSVQVSGGIEQRAAELLDLIHQKGQHHQVNKHLAQALLAKAEVMAELVPLVLQGVEGLVLYLPPGPGTTHELVRIFLRDRQVGDPGKAQRLLPLGIILPILDKSDFDILAALVERSIVDDAETVGDFFILLVG